MYRSSQINNDSSYNRMQESNWHLHTRYIKPQERMSQVPYQNLKRHIDFNNFFNPNHVEKASTSSPEDAIREIQKLMNGQESSIDKEKLKNISGIKLAPIVNDNYMSSFNENDYKLRPEDKVKIMKEKVFKVQNYYNYLYELETKKKVQQVNNTLQNLLREKVKEQEQQERPQSSEKNNLQDQSWAKPYEHSFSRGPRNQPRDPKQLDPVHSKFESKKSGFGQSGAEKSQYHFLKEKDRRELQDKYERFM